MVALKITRIQNSAANDVVVLQIVKFDSSIHDLQKDNRYGPPEFNSYVYLARFSRRNATLNSQCGCKKWTHDQLLFCKTLASDGKRVHNLTRHLEAVGNRLEQSHQQIGQDHLITFLSSTHINHAQVIINCSQK